MSIIERGSVSVTRSASWWSHFVALLKRNATIKRKRLFGTGKNELLVSFSNMVTVVITYYIFGNAYYQPITTEGVTSSILDESYTSILLTSPIAVAPDNQNIREFMDGPVQQMWQNYNSTPLNFTYYSSSDDIESQYLTWNAEFKIAVIFMNNLTSTLNVTLRNDPRVKPLPRTDNRFASTEECRVWPEDTLPVGIIGMNTCAATQYLDSGIAPLQAILQYAWMHMTLKLPAPNISVQLFPKPGAKASYFWSSLVSSYIINFTFTFTSFMLPLFDIFIGDKENQVRVYLDSVCVPYSAYLASWNFIQIVVFTIMSLGYCLLSLLIFPHSSFLLLFVYYWTYYASVLSVVFLFTPLFSHVKATGLMLLLILILALLTMGLTLGAGSIPVQVLWALSIFSPCAFGFSLGQLAYVDQMGIGATFESWVRSDIGVISVRFGFIMVVIDTIVYFIIGCLLHIFLENSGPEKMKHRKKQSFITRSLSFKEKPGSAYHQMEEHNPSRISLQSSADDAIYENVPQDMTNISTSASLTNPKEGIILKGITKCFGRKKKQIHILKDITLSMYEGHITVIVGHSGSGKSTLLNLLHGTRGSFEGDLTVYGMNVADHLMIKDIRRMSSICLQKDALPRELTVVQHMRLCAFWKGIANDVAENDINFLLGEFDLTEEKYCTIGSLSQSERRVIAVSCALIGKPKILLLDEPTHRMDSQAREKLWSLLEKWRNNRVIVVTSNYIDEANILGTRIALLSRGHLHCSGTSSDLRNVLAPHCRLIINLSDDNDTSDIFQLVSEVIPQSVRVHSMNETELLVDLPQEQSALYPQLFSMLDTERTPGGKLRGVSYSVAMTTLEEGYSHLLSDEQNQRNEEEVEKERLKEEELLKRCFNAMRKGKSQLPQDVSPTEFLNPATGSPPSTFSKFSCFLKFRILQVSHSRVRILLVNVILPWIFLLVAWSGIANQDVFPIKDSTFDVVAGVYNDSAVLYNPPSDSKGYIPHFFTTMQQVINGANPNNNVSIIPYNGSFDSLDNGSYWIAVDFLNLSTNQISIQIRFNDTDQHTIPVIITMVTETMVKIRSGVSVNETEMIVNIEPLPDDSIPEGIDRNRIAAANFYGVGFGLIPIGPLATFTRDRESNVRLLLRLTSLPSTVYFVVQFIIIIGICSVTIVGAQLFILSINVPFFQLGAALGSLCIHTYIYCVDVMILTACAAFAFKTKDSAIDYFNANANVLAIIPFLAITSFDMLGHSPVATALHIAMCFINPFYLPYGLFYYINKEAWICLGQQEGCSQFTWSLYFLTPELLSAIVAELTHISVALVVIFCIDVITSGRKPLEVISLKLGIGKRYKGEVGHTADSESVFDSASTIASCDEEESVISERKKSMTVLNLKRKQNYHLVTQRLCKEYPEKKTKSCRRRQKPDVAKYNISKIAVDNLSMSVESGEIIGFLGHNEAGKTTVIKMLIGDEKPTSGKIFIDGTPFYCSSPDRGHNNVSYCPQTSILFVYSTVREQLDLFASLQGLEKSDRDTLINHTLCLLQIEKYKDILLINCNECTKRKVALAIALIGGNRFVLLDEPTRGIDPESRKHLWTVLSSTLKQTNRSVVITTNMTAEAEATCSRFAIMLSGKLKCIGTSTEIKKIMCSKYFIEIKMKPTSDVQNINSGRNTSPRNSQNLVQFFKTHLLNVYVLKTYDRYIVFEIQEEDLPPLYKAFELISKAKELWDLDVCILGKKSLDGAFLDLERIQQDSIENLLL